MRSQPKCFLYHKPGHKSFDCPDKGKSSEPSKGAGVKPGQPSAKKVNLARAGQAVASLQGAVNGTLWVWPQERKRRSEKKEKSKRNLYICVCH